MSQQFGKMTIPSVEPVLVLFLFSGVRQFVDGYFTFCSEPMHSLSAEKNCLLKRCLRNILNYKNKDFDVVKTAARMRRSLKSL